MIILEGPDHSGKTTLLTELVKSLGYNHKHPGGAPKTLAEEANFMIEQKNISHEHYNLVHDRVTCISQPVYNTMRGNGTNGDQYIPYIRQFEFNPNVVIVYCRPPLDNMLIMANHEVKAHETVEHVRMVEQNQRQLVAAYDAIMANIVHVKYDYTTMSVKDLIAQLRKLNKV